MPLVDYGSSDESGSEEHSNEEENSNVTSNDIKESDQLKSVESRPSIQFEEEEQKSDILKTSQDYKNEEFCREESQSDLKLFSTLPTPRSNVSLAENSFKVLNKSKLQPVKIVLPSLSEMSKNSDEDVKKKKPSVKGSGLFALLPAPKNINSLVPKSVSKKPIIPIKRPLKLLPKKPMPNPMSSIKKNDKDEEEEDEPWDNKESFFFTSHDDSVTESTVLDNIVAVKPLIPQNADYSSNVAGSFERPYQISSNYVLPDSSHQSSDMNYHNSYEVSYSSDNIYPLPDSTHVSSSSTDTNDIGDEAIEKLCGTRARKRKGDVPEEIIDINVNSIVGDSYLLLSKDLTIEQERKSFKKPKNLSLVERRKHQITYLASQAKEKELELRNQWANSRMTRQQTQSKYGF